MFFMQICIENQSINKFLWNAQQNYFTPALFLIHKRLSIYINFILNRYLQNAFLQQQSGMQIRICSFWFLKKDFCKNAAFMKQKVGK